MATVVANTLGKVIEKSTEQNTARCKLNPGTCLWQVCVDAIVFVALFTSMSMMIDHRVPKVDSLITFASIWIPVNFALAAMDLELRDQLPRVAGWTLAGKIVSVMST